MELFMVVVAVLLPVVAPGAIGVVEGISVEGKCHRDCCNLAIKHDPSMPVEALRYPAAFCKEILSVINGDPCGYVKSGATKNAGVAKSMCTCFHCRCEKKTCPNNSYPGQPPNPTKSPTLAVPTPGPTPVSWLTPNFDPNKYDGEVEMAKGMVGVPKQAVYEELQVTSPPNNAPCSTERAKKASVVTVQYIAFLYFPEKKQHGTEKVDASFR
jgi:hypothetical protein